LLEAAITDRFINECNIVTIEENNDSETNDDVTTADRTHDGDGSARANLSTTNSVLLFEKAISVAWNYFGCLSDQESFYRIINVFKKKGFFVVNIHYPTKVTTNMIA